MRHPCLWRFAVTNRIESDFYSQTAVGSLAVRRLCVGCALSPRGVSRSVLWLPRTGGCHPQPPAGRREELLGPRGLTLRRSLDQVSVHDEHLP